MFKKINLSIYIAILLSLLLVGCAKRNDTKDETIVSEIPQTKMETQEETTSNSTIESIDLEKAFKNINGCAVIYSPKNNHYSFYNEDMCKQQVSPYSTFKIISVLSGLENGVLSDETSKMSYNGTIYANADWNADLSLKDAFQKSCIWYFKQVIDTVGKDKIKEELNNSVVVFAGPSGVGKSSLLNEIDPNFKLQTGEVSDKIKRGKHTTRHAELLKLECGGIVADTPGFSSLTLDDIAENELKEYFIEFDEVDTCKFGNKCIHENEPGCGVKEAVEAGEISKIRYDSYIQLLNEIRQGKRRY